MRRILGPTLILVPLIQACSNTSDYSEDLASLIETERAFASMSVASGTRAAFLEFLSDSGIVFAAAPTNGIELLNGSPDSESLLFWQPVFADVSAAGDLGYTTGPWERSETRDSEPSLFGHYVTFWKRNADNTWKLAIDGGINHDRFPDADSIVGFPELRSQSGDQQPHRTAGSSTQAELLELDRAYSLLAGDSGVATALASFASPDARTYRDGLFPILARDEALSVISGGSYNQVSWEPMAAVVSASGDLGFTYGIATVSMGTDQERPANYLHIWKRIPESGWNVVLDLLTPSPPTESQ